MRRLIPRVLTSVMFVGAVLAASVVSATPWFHDAGAKARGSAEPKAVTSMPMNYGYVYRAPAPVVAPRPTVTPVPTVTPAAPAPNTVVATAPTPRRSFSYTPAPVTRSPMTYGRGTSAHGVWRADTKTLGHSTF